MSFKDKIFFLTLIVWAGAFSAMTLFPTPGISWGYSAGLAAVMWMAFLVGMMHGRWIGEMPEEQQVQSNGEQR